jgi:hypothetical protein
VFDADTTIAIRRVCYHGSAPYRRRVSPRQGDVKGMGAGWRQGQHHRAEESQGLSNGRVEE